MRVARRFFAVAVLLGYAVQVVGGMALHSLQCAHEGDCSPTCESNGCDHAHEHSHHDGRSVAHDPSEHAPHAPADGSRHDPSQCQVCQVLGQAQTPASYVEIPLSGTVAPAIVTFDVPIAPSPCILGFQSRAPPGV